MKRLSGLSLKPWRFDCAHMLCGVVHKLVTMKWFRAYYTKIRLATNRLHQYIARGYNSMVWLAMALGYATSWERVKDDFLVKSYSILQALTPRATSFSVTFLNTIAAISLWRLKQITLNSCGHSVLQLESQGLPYPKHYRTLSRK